MIGWDSCSGLGFGHWALMIAFWGVFIVTALWVVSRIFPKHDPRADVQELLDQRLAAGEIDTHTYRLVRDELVNVSRN